MNKKEYITPSVRVKAVDCSEMLAGSEQQNVGEAKQQEDGKIIETESKTNYSSAWDNEE